MQLIINSSDNLYIIKTKRILLILYAICTRPMLNLMFISSRDVILLGVLFHLKQTIFFKCFDYLLVEQTWAWIND